MNHKFCLLTLIFASLLVSCAKVSGSKSAEVVIDDRPAASSKNEIIIDDKTFNAEIGKDASNPSEISQQPTKTNLADNSKIDTTFDGFGNKTETRYFNNHLRLRFLMLRTSADGKKQIFVYGQNGQVKSLPEDMIGKALAASADEIANSAGIYQTYRPSSPPAPSQRNEMSLRPLPSYNFPTQDHQTEPIPAEQTTRTAEPANEKTEEGNNESKPSDLTPKSQP